MNIEIVNKIKRLQAAKGFVIKTKKEQENILRTAKVLQNHGIIKFSVVTRKHSEGWKVAAV